MTQDFPEEFGGHNDPNEIFKLWFDEAHRTQMKEPTAFTLSTINSDGHPDSRILLCKEIRDRAFVFYTNYNSAKGQEIANNSHVAANFYWDSLFRQIRIRGHVKRMDRVESEKYWNSRPRSSQLSQWVSKQSETLSSREEMLSAIKAAEEKFLTEDIPCPDHWGGYLLNFNEIEFWVGRTGRFHDRHLFTMVENEWTCRRLYP